MTRGEEGSGPTRGGPSAAADLPAAEVERLRALADERAALLRVAELVARAGPATEVFDAVVSEASRLLHGQPTALTRFDGGDELVVVASGDAAPVGARIRFEPDTLPDRVRRRSEVVRVDDYTGERDAELARSYNLTAAVAVPVRLAGAVWGMLTATSPTEPLPPGTERRLEPFTQLVAAAVGNSQALAELRALAEEQAALRRVAELTARGASADEVLQAVAVEGTRLTGVDFTTLTRFDADGAIEIVALSGSPSGFAVGMRDPEPGDSAATRVRRTGRPARIDELGAVAGRWPRISHRAGFAASVAVPIRDEGALWGALVGVSRDRSLPPGIEDQLVRFADLVGTAIAAAEARRRLRALADEQAALRRVAELVAHGTTPDEVFVAVSEEASALLGDLPVALMLYDDTGARIVATCNSPAPLGLHLPFSAGSAVDRVYRTGRPAQMDAYASTPLAGLAREFDVARTTAVPITVEGRIRAALVASTAAQRLPADTATRLAPFAELVAVAIANAEANAQLTASRARIVATADETRRRLQRDVHDGAQQRLVHALIALKMARTVAVGSAAADLVEEALTNVERATRELRDIVHGILPASLTRGGLRLGLESLVVDLALAVDLHVTVPRLPAAVETTAYFVVAEALTNAVKHAQARAAGVDVELDGDTVVVEVRDDGVGGADPSRGTGLTGLLDRVDAAEGILTIVSPTGAGTVVRAELPVGSGDRTATPSGPRGPS